MIKSIEVNVVTGERVEVMTTPDEEAAITAARAAYVAGEPTRKATEIRATRNQLIKDCDWTQVADAPVDQTAWATYRQELRDISDLTKQPDFPLNVTWPVAPV